jgi:TonB family protein
MATRDPLSTRIATALVRHAARHAPGELADRLGEEWQADLAAQRGAFQRLRFALGCCWARQVIARDPLWARAQARSVAVAQGTPPAAFDALLAPAPSPLSRRTLVLLAIVALHVAVIAAFAFGVRVIPGPRESGPFVAQFFPPKAAPTDPPPPVVKPTLEKPRYVDPIVHTTFDLRDAIDPPRNPVDIAPPRDGAAATAHVQRVPGGPGAGFPSADEFYPSQSIRLEETGAASVQVCVDARGRLTAAPVIAATSGSPRLDGGALALARAGSGHYRSATEDGNPVAACFPIRVRFALRQ